MDYRKRHLEAKLAVGADARRPGARPRPGWRRQSVIVCLRLGRALQLEIVDARDARRDALVYGCGCKGFREDLPESEPRGVAVKPSTRTMPPGEYSPTELSPGASSPADQAVASDTSAETTWRRVADAENPRAPTATPWMPTTRRLLLEPAPERICRMPSSPLPRTMDSAASRRLSWRMSSSRSVGGMTGIQESACDVPRSPSLRVLTPDELELRGPALGVPAPPAPRTADVPDVLDVPVREARDSGRQPRVPKDVDDGAEDGVAARSLTSSLSISVAAVAQLSVPQQRHNRRQWLLQVVRDNFNEQIGLLVERFVRSSHQKSVRRVPGIGRKVNVNLQDFWRRSSGQDRHMKTQDLLSVYNDSGMDWKAFQKWLIKDLQFMPSCAKLTALSLDIYHKYWSTEWGTTSSPPSAPSPPS